MVDWRDRTKEPAYTSPLGTRRTFLYEDLSKQATKKTTAFEFPDRVGTYIQDLGATGDSYPIRCIFAGKNCDEDAESFFKDLLVAGIGILEHPVYGVKEVVPFGTINRSDPRAKGANETYIDVVFRETIGLVYPEEELYRKEAVEVGLAGWTEQAAIEFEDKIDAPTVLDRKNLADNVNDLVDSANESLKPMYDTFESVQKGYTSIESSITRGINTLVGKPLTLAFQTAILIQAPARTLASFEDKLKGYKSLVEGLLGIEPKDNNEYNYNNVSASSAVAGVVGATTNSDYSTQRQATEAAVNLISLYNDLQEWKDDQSEARGISESPEAYSALQSVVALAAGRLVSLALNLKKEVRFELVEKRNIIELEYELYGTVDENLDFLIESNKLSGSEILSLPAGKEILYYV